MNQASLTLRLEHGLGPRMGVVSIPSEFNGAARSLPKYSIGHHEGFVWVGAFLVCLMA